MDEAIVMDEGRVEGDAIGVECDRGELEVQSVVVPLIITDLLQLPEELDWAGTLKQGPVEEGNPTAVDSQRVMREAILMVSSSFLPLLGVTPCFIQKDRVKWSLRLSWGPEPSPLGPPRGTCTAWVPLNQ